MHGHVWDIYNYMYVSCWLYKKQFSPGEWLISFECYYVSFRLSLRQEILQIILDIVSRNPQLNATQNIENRQLGHSPLIDLYRFERYWMHIPTRECARSGALIEYPMQNEWASRCIGPIGRLASGTWATHVGAREVASVRVFAVDIYSRRQAG